jgi:hypothetical protein
VFLEGNRAERGAGSKRAKEESPVRVVCVLGRNVAGRWALVGSLEGKSSQLGRRRGRRVLILGALSPGRSFPPAISRTGQHCRRLRAPLLPLGTCSSQCFLPLLPRFLHFHSPIRAGIPRHAALVCAFTTCHIQAPLSWQRPPSSPIGQARTPASHTALDWCWFLASVAGGGGVLGGAGSHSDLSRPPTTASLQHLQGPGRCPRSANASLQTS